MYRRGGQVVELRGVHVRKERFGSRLLSSKDLDRPTSCWPIHQERKMEARLTRLIRKISHLIKDSIESKQATKGIVLTLVMNLRIYKN